MFENLWILPLSAVLLVVFQCADARGGPTHPFSVQDLMDMDRIGDFSLYEVEANSYEEAERVLNDWQRDPDAWEGRTKHRETGQKFEGMPMRVNGSGWYELIKFFDGPKAGAAQPPAVGARP